jgi:hypothetical protein
MNRLALFIVVAGLALSLNAQTPAQKEAVRRQKEQLKFENATPQKVMQLFQENGFQNQHPRQFATQADIDRVKSLIHSGDPLMTKAWERMKKLADENLIKPLHNGDLDEAKLRVKGTHANAVLLPPLVIAYWITGENKYAQRAYEVFANMATWPDWGTLIEPPFTDRHYLDTGIAAFDAALIYDGLYHWMNPEQRDFVYQTTQKYLFVPTLSQYRNEAKRTWQWNKANNNWNGICNGNIAVAALCMFERDPQTMSWLVATAANDMQIFMREFEPDGQSEEGLMYWGYGLMYTLPAFDCLQRNLGTTFGLAETPGMRKTGYFPVYSTGTVTSINIGDDPLKTGKAKSFFWPARHHRNASLARLQYDMVMAADADMPWFDFFYYEPELVKQGSKIDVPLDHAVYGLELYSMRENWTDHNAFYVSVHGGYNSASHGHLDAGSFYVQALGEVWAYGNLGRDDYTFPGYFSKRTFPEYKDSAYAQKEPGRWHFYRMRAEGKNCLVFNHSNRPDQDEKGTARVIRQASTADAGYYILDLGEVYNRDVIHYERGIKLDRKKQIITIQDEFTTREKSTVWWSMHTQASICISGNGKTAYLTQNNKQLMVTLSGAGKARFSVMPASYLPGVELPMTKNSENNGFKKLCIRMDNTDKAAFMVEVMPMKTKGKQFKKLRKW